MWGAGSLGRSSDNEALLVVDTRQFAGYGEIANFHKTNTHTQSLYLKNHWHM